MLFRQGDPATFFVLVTDGEATVTRDDGDGDQQIGTAGPGSIVGELGLLRGRPRLATVTPNRPVTGMRGDAKAFAALLDVPGVADHLTHTVRQRLAANARPVPVAAADGTPLVLRPLLPSDRPHLVAALERFSPESYYRRFFTAGPLSGRLIDYLVNVDYFDHFAWVVLDGEDGVASARCIRLADDAETAEVAFAVIDEYQSRGIGKLLVGALAAAAQQTRIRRFTAQVLANNTPMRAILDGLGAKWRWDSGGVVTTTVDVPDPGAYLPDRPTEHALRAAVREIATAAGLALV